MATVPFTFPGHRELCYYPSSGHQMLWAVMNLPHDLFVFSDKMARFDFKAAIEKDFARAGCELTWLPSASPEVLCFESGGKQGVLFQEDNNVTLRRLSDAGLRVAHFVGICDGCCEGGNHECVHDRPFLSRLLPLCVEGARYTTDHSQNLEDAAPYSSRGVSHKFRHQAFWNDFVAPPGDFDRLDPDLHEQVTPTLRFVLAAVLVLPFGERANPKAKDGGFVVMDMAHSDALLRRLLPFRTVLHRPRLAEFRITHTDQPEAWDDYQDALLARTTNSIMRARVAPT